MRRRVIALAIGAAATLMGAVAVALLGQAVALPGSAIEDGMADTRKSFPVLVGGRAYLERP